MGKENNKIASLENEFHKEQMRRQKFYENQVSKRTRRILVFSLIGLFGVLIAFGRILQDGKKLQELKQSEAVAIEESQSLAKKEQELQEDVALLKDEDYVAKLARSRYLLTLDGEQVYAFKKDHPETKENPKISVEKEK